MPSSTAPAKIAEAASDMEYRLKRNLGYSTIHRIGDYLRAHGTGKHWVEKDRGDIFIHASEERDEAILQNEFADVLEAVNDTMADKHG
jgi:hypothetical protein